MTTAAATPDLWVTASGDDDTCARGDQNQPCLTLNGAYQVAECGDLVSVSGDRVDEPELDDRPALDGCAAPVQFVAEGSVLLSCSGDPCWAFTSGAPNASSGGASWLTLDGFSINGNVWIAGADHDTITNATGTFGVNTRGATNFTLSDSMTSCQSRNYSPRTVKCDLVPFAADGDTDTATISNVTFAGFKTGGGDHGECIHAFGMTRLVVERSRFYDCSQYGIMLEMGAAACSGGCFIQNNWFGPGYSAAIDFGGQPNTSMVIRFNSFNSGGLEGDLVNTSNTVTASKAIGNIFSASTTAGDCVTGITYSYNVWPSGSCGAGDTTEAALPYLNMAQDASMDYHLAGDLGPADNFVPCGTGDAHLTVDIDGDSRPIGANCDAGADER